MEFSYYPGCSLESTACEYDRSVRAVFETLDVGLTELEDWNCCGASSAHSLSQPLSVLLPARNLALAQSAGLEVVMPCAACYNRHRTVEHILKTEPDRRAWIEEMTGFQFKETAAVRPLLAAICEDIGLEQVRAHVRKPLTGLKAVAYYGCLLVRPPEITGFDDPEHPVLMDRLLETLGAEARRWSYATECCGGGLSLTRPEIAARLVRRLADHAREAGAQVLVTSCPLCQVNLEMRQDRSETPLPVFYFSELVGLAFGLKAAEGWWKKHLIDPLPLLRSLGLDGKV